MKTNSKKHQKGVPQGAHRRGAVTCRQLAVSQTHADVVQSHRAAVPEAPAGADESHLNNRVRPSAAEQVCPTTPQNLTSSA